MTDNPLKSLKGEVRYLETILEIVPDNSQAPTGGECSLTVEGCNDVRRNLETCIRNLKGIIYEMAGEV